MTEAEKTGPRIGLFENHELSNGEYHHGPGISKSGLDIFRRSPAHYIFQRRHPKPPTQSMVVGDALHALILEPARFERDFCQARPENAPRRPTKAQVNAKNPSDETRASVAFWAEWDEKNKGKREISTTTNFEKGPVWGCSDWDMIHHMRDAVLSHKTASILLADGGKPEVSGYWVDQEYGKLCKLRMDWWGAGHNIIVDLKSTFNASYSEFARSVVDYFYHVQDAWYREGMWELKKPVYEFVFVVVEKEPPYGVGVYTLDKKAKELGARIARSDLRRFAKCHNEDKWPCYPEEPRDLFLPAYAERLKIS